jgi:hypothetical protein
MPEEDSNDGNRQNDTSLENDDNPHKNNDNSRKSDVNSTRNDNCLENDASHNKNTDNHHKNIENHRNNTLVTLKILSKDLQARKCLLEKNLKKMWLAGFEGPLALPDLQFRCKNNKIVFAHKIAFALVSSSFLKKIII